MVSQNVSNDQLRVGVTGHMNLTADTIPLVRAEIRKVLGVLGPDLIGVSCLAAGADTIFAEVILDLGGELEVVVPSVDYRQSKVKPDHASVFDHLLERATLVRTLPFSQANRDAYEAANRELLDSSDALLAVWDGEAPADRGGTAAVVDEAVARGLRVEVVWPPGARRET